MIMVRYKLSGFSSHLLTWCTGGNPLAHIATNNPDYRLTAFGGEFQPGLYRYVWSRFASHGSLLRESAAPRRATLPTQLHWVCPPLH
jgi:hypothetical protein